MKKIKKDRKEMLRNKKIYLAGISHSRSSTPLTLPRT